ncbi:MAG: hypothetical protein QME79_10210 [Bacillota bacterium]|nr:hypothetical protein [Bacillota bacterium]
MLTDRSREFLEKVKKLYAETQEPIHYTTVGKLLGVSRWTAYDMLKALQEKGYLRSEYSLSASRGKSGGRSQVLFAPTEKSLQEEPAAEAGCPADWCETKERVMQFFQAVGGLKPQELLDRILRVPNIETPLVFCAYVAGLLVTFARTRASRRVAWLKAMLFRFTRPELGLAGFAGTLLGLLITAVEPLGMEDTLLNLVGKFQQKLEQMSRQERRLLLDFVKDVLLASETAS